MHAKAATLANGRTTRAGEAFDGHADLGKHLRLDRQAFALGRHRIGTHHGAGG